MVLGSWLVRMCGVDVAVFAAAAVVVHVADSLRMLSTKSLPFWFGEWCLYRLPIALGFASPSPKERGDVALART